MSVIYRIEVANLLNGQFDESGDVASPRDARRRHLPLDPRGQSSAIGMANGFGWAGTLVEARAEEVLA